MAASVASPPKDVRSLAHSFTSWIERSAVGRNHAAASVALFVIGDKTAILDVTRAGKLIRSGVRSGHVAELVTLLGLEKKEDLSHALNATGTTLWRWAKSDQPLPGPTVEQILRAMQLRLFAVEVFGTIEQARTWLNKPHPSLEGMTPSDYANNEFGAQKVRGMLAGLKYGGVA